MGNKMLSKLIAIYMWHAYFQEEDSSHSLTGECLPVAAGCGGETPWLHL